MLNLLNPNANMTLGNQFKYYCIVGLGGAELFTPESTEPIRGDNWQEITDETTRRKMALLFFAPRQLDGTPLPPAETLAQSTSDPEALETLEQQLEMLPLIDLCRMPPASPNTVNFLVAADTIFHWDFSDNYVTPTTQYSWVRDVTQILKHYPRATEAVVYTNWQPERVGELNTPIRPLNELPVNHKIWINPPTVQERYGTVMLAAAVGAIALAYSMIAWQNQTMDSLDEQIMITQQKIPREGQFAALSRFMLDQEKYMSFRDLYPWLVSDVARSIQLSNMKLDNFGVENPSPNEPTDTLLATLEAQKNAYKGWLEEEPIAKDILMNSASLAAVRKPPGNNFKLEGLIPLEETRESFNVAVETLKEMDEDTPSRTNEAEDTGGNA